MSRRFSAPKRQIIPDAKYGDQLVAKFVNSLMLAGKRSTAEKCLYGAFNIIEERFKEEPLDVFKKALDAVKPRVEVKSRRVGGATYQVPVEVRSEKTRTRWPTRTRRLPIIAGRNFFGVWEGLRKPLGQGAAAELMTSRT
jgi:ribosomal protein S7